MRRKVLAALVVVMLFCNSVPVLAGNTLPINHGNKYVYAVDGGRNRGQYLSLEIID